jgi:hypothetical protein
MVQFPQAQGPLRFRQPPRTDSSYSPSSFSRHACRHPPQPRAPRHLGIRYPHPGRAPGRPSRASSHWRAPVASQAVGREPHHQQLPRRVQFQLGRCRPEQGRRECILYPKETTNNLISSSSGHFQDRDRHLCRAEALQALGLRLGHLLRLRMGRY